MDDARAVIDDADVDDDGGLALALALSASDGGAGGVHGGAQRSLCAGKSKGEARLPHLSPTDVWGELDDDEALALALALSRADAPTERAARDSAGESRWPSLRAAPTLPPGLRVAGATAARRVDDHASSAPGFAAWAYRALEACTGEADNEVLVDFLVAIGDVDEQLDYLAEVVGASRELRDEWLARRLNRPLP